MQIAKHHLERIISIAVIVATNPCPERFNTMTLQIKHDPRESLKKKQFKDAICFDLDELYLCSVTVPKCLLPTQLSDELINYTC